MSVDVAVLSLRQYCPPSQVSGSIYASRVPNINPLLVQVDMIIFLETQCTYGFDCFATSSLVNRRFLTNHFPVMGVKT